jgi:hypothetical protein
MLLLFLSPSPMAAPTPQISLPSLLSPSPTIYGQPNVISDNVKGIKCQPWLIGLWVLKGRKKGTREDRF